MTSWRDTASTSAQEDLDGLLNAVLPLAQDMLDKRGEFYPFGATVSADGKTSLAAADPGHGDRPPSADVLASLYDGVRADATTMRAAAFVADVRTKATDAVRVELEHKEQTSLVVLLPYTRSRFKKTLTFGQMSVSRGQPRIWTDG